MNTAVLWALMVVNVNGGHPIIAWMFQDETSCKVAKEAFGMGAFSARCVPLKGGKKP